MMIIIVIVGVFKKEGLSQEEQQQLIATHYDNEKPNIRKAFILCLYCGLRFCDVKDLTFANVDYSNKLLKFEQNKTKVTMFAIGTPTFRKKRRQDVAQSQWGLSAPSRRLPPSVFHSIL